MEGRQYINIVSTLPDLCEYLAEEAIFLKYKVPAGVRQPNGEGPSICSPSSVYLYVFGASRPLQLRIEHKLFT